MFFQDYKKHKSAKLDLYLLWDVDTTRIQWKKWRSLIIERVVERGNRNDWYFILNKYGIETVKNEIMAIKWVVDHKYFISTLLHIPLSKIKCYSRKQSRKILSRS